ncbi:MAG: hypothetical protein QG606_257 [Patescibacteria group bacterium]|nr:hypothetical protein [Patescibacteria group bacterium]
MRTGDVPMRSAVSAPTDGLVARDTKMNMKKRRRVAVKRIGSRKEADMISAFGSYWRSCIGSGEKPKRAAPLVNRMVTPGLSLTRVFANSPSRIFSKKRGMRS